MKTLTNTLVNGSAQMGTALTGEQLHKFQRFYQLMLETNRHVNLTSIVQEEDVAVKHYLDSLTCLRIIPPEQESSLADIGTGAGFPGIPIKICRAELRVTMVDSLEKRVLFLKKAIAELSLDLTEAVHARAEEIGRNSNYRGKYDFVVSRAVAVLGVLAEYCLPVVKTGGTFIAMKGPKLEEELRTSKMAIEALGGELTEIIKLYLPFSGDERNLVLIKKTRETPEKYPRRVGVPQKKPL